MKKLLGSVFLLCGFIASGSAFALDKGADMCHTMLLSLHENGYSENETYTPEGIVQLLQKNNIEAPDMSSFTNGQHYKLKYTCTKHNKLAKPKLTALPQDASIPSGVVTIKWKATKPIRG